MYSTQFRPMSQGAFLPAVRLSSAPAGPLMRPGAQTFGGSAHGTPPFLGQVQLGQTAETWYKRARASLERFWVLKNQIQSIDNKVARDSLTAWLGSAGIPDTPEYRYASVNQDFTVDASPENEGIQAYTVSRRQNRVEKLEAFNDELNQKIEAARVTYGARPTPTAPAPAPAPVSAGPDLTLPLVGLAAIIGIALLA